MRFALSLLLLCATAHCAAPTPEPAASSKALNDLTAWLSGARDQRKPLMDTDFSRVALTKPDAARAADLLWQDHLANLRASRTAELSTKTIHALGHGMKFDMVSFGDKNAVPPGGRSLFISMHGGGSAPTSLNDSQWENQIKLAQNYHPKEGIYVAPRAPSDAWNMWHEAHIDPLFDRLIEDFVALENVNPNRVYLMGYSAGGDGVYQLAPRMADRWAACAMMAGHPNETQPLGLRNVPFALQVGANDAGFNRNKIAVEWGEKLDALQKADPNGYAHFVELHAGKGHWMDGDDRKAVPWMERYTRNPLPTRIAWRQDDVLHFSSYWLAVPKDTAHEGQEIVAERKGQQIDITTKDVSRLLVRVNDAMMNLDETVTVQAGGKQVFRGRVTRTIAVLASTLAERGDRDLMFGAEISVNL
jgi:predicted peptidase